MEFIIAVISSMFVGFLGGMWVFKDHYKDDAKDALFDAERYRSELHILKAELRAKESQIRDLLKMKKIQEEIYEKYQKTKEPLGAAVAAPVFGTYVKITQAEQPLTSKKENRPSDPYGIQGIVETAMKDLESTTQETFSITKSNFDTITEAVAEVAEVVIGKEEDINYNPSSLDSTAESLTDHSNSSSDSSYTGSDGDFGGGGSSSDW